jgi:hypothetical protein
MSQPQRLLILFRIKRGAVEVLKFARVLGSSVSFSITLKWVYSYLREMAKFRQDYHNIFARCL